MIVKAYLLSYYTVVIAFKNVAGPPPGDRRPDRPLLHIAKEIGRDRPPDAATNGHLIGIAGIYRKTGGRQARFHFYK
jgi:hypothetical protein